MMLRLDRLFSLFVNSTCFFFASSFFRSKFSLFSFFLFFNSTRMKRYFEICGGGIALDAVQVTLAPGNET